MTVRVTRAIGPRARVLALTWVHSSTGLKIPVRAICDAVADINRGRDENRRVLVCVDAVHGFGNQDDSFSDLGYDLMMTSCHKWLFGPRGTGIVAGTRAGWAAMRPIIPSFIDDGVLDAWVTGRTSRRATPPPPA